MNTTRLGPVTPWGELGTQELQSKIIENDREDDGEYHHPTTNITGVETPWGDIGTQDT